VDLLGSSPPPTLLPSAQSGLPADFAAASSPAAILPRALPGLPESLVGGSSSPAAALLPPSTSPGAEATSPGEAASEMPGVPLPPLLRPLRPAAAAAAAGRGPSLLQAVGMQVFGENWKGRPPLALRASAGGLTGSSAATAPAVGSREEGPPAPAAASLPPAPRPAAGPGGRPPPVVPRSIDGIVRPGLRPATPGLALPILRPTTGGAASSGAVPRAFLTVGAKRPPQGLAATRPGLQATHVAQKLGLAATRPGLQATHVAQKLGLAATRPGPQAAHIAQKLVRSNLDKVQEDISNDWRCDACGERNFARRIECFKCKAPRGRSRSREREPDRGHDRDRGGGRAEGEDTRMWYYKDTQGIVQGPFASSVMSGWCRQGLFPPETQVRAQDEAEFSELGNGIRLLTAALPLDGQ